MVAQDVSFPTLPVVKAHLIVNCALVFLALVVVGLRLFSRFSSGTKLWWDDYLILFAVPQGIGMLVIQGLWAPMGIGYPTVETLPNIVVILKLLVAYELIFATCMSTIKLSIMFFYLRIFVNPGLRLATKCVMGFVLLWTAGNILQVFLICHPFEATYNTAIKGTCGDRVASFIAIGAFNIVTDIMILALPLPSVWALKMNMPAKAGVTAIFIVGLAVSVVAIIRIVSLTSLDLLRLTETMVWADFWSTFEPNLSIIGVSMPALGSLYSRCTARRGASKLDGPSDPSCYKRANRFARSQPSVSGTIALECIYSPDKEVHYTSEIAALDQHPAAHGGRDGPEAPLTPDMLLGREKTAIAVQTKWSISRHTAY